MNWIKWTKILSSANQKFVDSYNFSIPIEEKTNNTAVKLAFMVLFEEASGGQYGECKFDVLFKERRTRVKKELRGTIARTYLYFNKQYEMKLSKQETKKFKAWDKEYPPNILEIERNKRIFKVQGNSNELIK